MGVGALVLGTLLVPTMVWCIASWAGTAAVYTGAAYGGALALSHGSDVIEEKAADKPSKLQAAAQTIQPVSSTLGIVGAYGAQVMEDTYDQAKELNQKHRIMERLAESTKNAGLAVWEYLKTDGLFSCCRKAS